ncbi:hypothetical protein B0H11DRAFT_1932724 [Mycena galericulata]|nr:hypothetical protein B0H11DRAFT_1932724 [Mycena galericulata]
MVQTRSKRKSNGEIAQYNFIFGVVAAPLLCDHANPTLVVGEEEMNMQSVNIRNRDDIGSKVQAEMTPLEDFAKKLVALKGNSSLHNKLYIMRSRLYTLNVL